MFGPSLNSSPFNLVNRTLIILKFSLYSGRLLTVKLVFPVPAKFHKVLRAFHSFLGLALKQVFSSFEHASEPVSPVDAFKTPRPLSDTDQSATKSPMVPLLWFDIPEAVERPGRHQEQASGSKSHLICGSII